MFEPKIAKNIEELVLLNCNLTIFSLLNLNISVFIYVLKHDCVMNISGYTSFLLYFNKLLRTK